jgi:hypothetical protein
MQKATSPYWEVAFCLCATTTGRYNGDLPSSHSRKFVFFAKIRVSDCVSTTSVVLYFPPHSAPNERYTLSTAHRKTATQSPFHSIASLWFCPNPAIPILPEPAAIRLCAPKQSDAGYLLFAAYPALLFPTAVLPNPRS